LDLPTAAIVSLFLAAAAIFLVRSHVRSWRAARQQDLSPAEFDFHRRQFRRRMQASGWLGVLAVAILGGSVLRPGSLFVFVWFGIFLAVVWVTILALADMVATRRHFDLVRHDNLVEEAKLQAEIRRLEAERKKKP
jgi:hypothetical protein